MMVYAERARQRSLKVLVGGFALGVLISGAIVVGSAQRDKGAFLRAHATTQAKVDSLARDVDSIKDWTRPR